jgi:thioredoxin domain-containing protein 5
MARMRVAVVISVMCAMILAAYPALAEDDAAEAVPSLVRVLTDSSFEHDTQAVTGATTGDWFVEFYAPWCGHCKRLEETWDKLAAKLAEDREAGEITPIIAKVDATQEKKIAERFKIGGFPTLLMFSKGQMYTYEGSRTLDALYEWCKNRTYRKDSSEPVPKGWDEMSPMEKAMQVFEATVKKDMEQIWNYHKAAFFLALGVVFLLGLLLGGMLCGGKQAKKKAA